MKRRYCTILLCILCLTSYAQNSNKELLKKLVEKEVLTQSEADDILKESNNNEPQDKIEETASKIRNAFNNNSYLQIGGYGLFMYQYSNTNDLNDVVRKAKHDARGRTIFVSARGKLDNNIGYFILTEFLDPMVYEFYGEWTPMKELNFKAGQQKVPISLENQISLTNLETVFNTRSVSSLIGMGDDVHRSQNGKNNTGRDIGIQTYGTLFKISDHDFIEYSAGIFQGSGLNTSDKDNSKDFAGTLLFLPIKGLRVGGSLSLGEATYYKTNTSELESHVRNRWMLSTDYHSECERFYARAEWISGKDGLTDREGVYGTAQYYCLPKKLSVVGKVDYYNQDKSINREVVDYLMGIDYYFYNKCRVQLNYQYSDFSEKWDEKNSHNIICQLQFVF